MTDDATWLRRLRTMWSAVDPCPEHVVDSAVFRLRLENIDVEVMRLSAPMSAAGARAAERFDPERPERFDTLMFQSPSLMLTLSMSPGGSGSHHLDGYLTPSASLTVRLHRGGDIVTTSADSDGRFAFHDVPAGLIQLTVEPTPGAAVHLPRTLITPAFQI